MRKALIVTLLLAIGMAISRPAVAEEITIVGSAFSGNNPGITVIVPPSIGSGGGIKAVGTGRNVLARVARKIRNSEKTYKLMYVPVAKIPIVFFANKAAGVRDISDLSLGITFNEKDRRI